MNSVPADPAASATTVEEVIRARLSHALGGWRGSAEAALPTVAFVVCWNLTKNLNVSLIAAAVPLVIALILRLIQRQTVRFVVAAAAATAFAAFLARRSGNASDVFLPGILQSAAMFVLALISIAAQWPMVGFIVAAADPNMAQDPTAWRRSAAMRRVCSRLTWVFAAMFGVRLAIMLPLYFAHNVTALGVCKIVLGWPLYLLTLGCMAALLMRGHTPLAQHDPLLHEDAVGEDALAHDSSHTR